MNFYGADLAFIHDRGFGRVALAAAGEVLGHLRAARPDWAAGSGERPAVADLGCGSGVLSRQLCDAGCRVLGVDVSAEMVALSRQLVPEGQFTQGSIYAAELPALDAVCMVGEIINYLDGDASSEAKLAALFARIFAALRPGGLLIFDSSGPGRAPEGANRFFYEDPECAVLADSSVDAVTKVLTRHIVTFRLEGVLFRRSAETHHLQLWEPQMLAGLLAEAGFAVETSTGYGQHALPVGMTVFQAQRPGE